MYYSTAQEFLLCKIYNLANEPSLVRYEREREIYELDLYPNLVKCISKTLFTVRKVNYGMLVFSELPKNIAVNEIGGSFSSFQLLKLTKTIL
jgi:hypothetical protein